MAQVSKTAVSKLIKEKRGEDDLDDESKKRSRDDFKKQKELEEQRKLGNAPAAVDESGKDINPHIPQYIFEIHIPWKARDHLLVSNMKDDLKLTEDRAF